jgi:hypothetical protein
MKEIIFSLIIMFSFVSSAFADEQPGKGCFSLKEASIGGNAVNHIKRFQQSG